jgi:hypothetical protein
MKNSHALSSLMCLIMFNYAVMVQTNRVEIKEIQAVLRFVCFKPENVSNEDSMLIKIAVSDSRCGVFSAFAGAYVRRIGLEKQNGA